MTNSLLLCISKFTLYLAMTFLLLACGGDEGGSTPITQASAITEDDKSPDAFSFSHKTQADLNSWLESESITLSGINTEAAISVRNGEYSVDNADFTSDDGTINNGQTLKLRVRSSTNFSASNSVSITLGGFEASFTVETLALDSTPEAFSFTNKNQTAPNTWFESENITLSGINTQAYISVQNGEYSIDNSDFTSDDGTINNGQTLKLRVRSSTNFSTSSSVSVTLGGFETNFTVKTPDSDTMPEAFSFTHKAQAALNSWIESENITLSGINTLANIAVINGEYSIDNGSFTSADGTINNSQTLKLRVRSSTAFSTSSSASITLGGFEASFTVETHNAPKITSLELLPNTVIKAGENIVVSATCSDCAPEKIRYEWRVEGVSQAVSNEDYYRIPREHLTKEISITSTAFDSANNQGSSMTRIYGLNHVKEIVGTQQAFAALKLDGSVVTWGDDYYGADSRSVATQLINIQSISATGRAFAAIKADGTVITWGVPSSGGDSKNITSQLTNIQSISATEYAFAAIKADGSVITWGHSFYGGNSSTVTDQLTQIHSISATNKAFAAIKVDGSVITWGDVGHGANSSAVADQLNQVQSIYATNSNFAAIKVDGSVITWGPYLSDSDLANQLTNVQSISATNNAFAAIKDDGTVITWGYASGGGDSSEVADQLNQVQSISATDYAFAAIKADGSVITWGNVDQGGDSSVVTDQLTQVQSISATDNAFAAIKADGSVITWGHTFSGADSSAVTDRLTQVQSISATDYAFAAVNGDGSVITWGHAFSGGDSSQLTQVQSISATKEAFAAIKADGSVITWGNHDSGGDSSDLTDQLNQVQSISATRGALPPLKPMAL